MAITIDTTISGENANSYSTVGEADTYFTGHLYKTAWTSSTTKEESLVMATRLLDSWVLWKGYRATEDQALRWPRYDVQDRDGYTYDSDIYPQFLKDATAELALYLLQNDPTAEPDSKGYSEMKVDSLMLKIDKSDRDSTTTIPDIVKSMVEPYGSIRKRGGSKQVKLLRS